jgi:hypothetical protein
LGWLATGVAAIAALSLIVIPARELSRWRLARSKRSGSAR